MSKLLIFLIFVNPEKISNIENLIDYIKEKTIPEFPINAKFLKELKEEGIDAQMIPWIDDKEN